MSPGDTPSTVADDHAAGRVDARSAAVAALPVVVVAVLLALVPPVVGDGRTAMGVATGVLVAIGYGVGVNVVLGLTGQLLLCIGALGAVGGYGVVLLADDHGWPLLAAVVAATIAASLLGGLFCWLSVRRSLDAIFTGIVTLAFALGVESVLLGQRTITGGEDGRRVRAAADTLLGDRVGGYYALLAAVVLCLAVFRWLERSHHGWAYRALRDDPTTAALAGIDVARHRVRAGAVGAAMVGLVGSLQALVETRIAPSTYSFTAVDVETLVVVAVGGLGRVLAPVVGGVTLGLLDEVWLRELGTLRLAVDGAVLLVVFLALRDGVLGALERWGRRRRGG